MSVLDKSPDRVSLCRQKLQNINRDFDAEESYVVNIDCDDVDIPGGPYDAIVATLALHTLAGHQQQGEDVLRQKYTNIFRGILKSLKPGGMFLYGDHVGTWSLYKQVTPFLYLVDMNG